MEKEERKNKIFYQPVNTIEKLNVVSEHIVNDNKDTKLEINLPQVTEPVKREPKYLKDFDAEKLKPFFIQFEEPKNEITDYDFCKNIILFLFVIIGLALVFLAGLGIAFSNILKE